MNSRGVFSRLVKGEAAGRTEVDGWMDGWMDRWILVFFLEDGSEVCGSVF